MSQIVVELSSAVPVYEQIRAQVSAAVAIGTLYPGDRLPASRDLARDLGIAVGTVQRAYQELEKTGVVESRRRTGTVIAAGPPGTEDGDGGVPTAIIAQAQTLVRAARRVGVSDEALMDIVRGAIATN